MESYELVIIGGGPAGAAAAVYAARKRLKTLLLTAEWGGQSVVSENIYNWIGTTSIPGATLAENLKQHVLANATGAAPEANGMESTLVTREDKVTGIAGSDGGFTVATESGKSYETKTVLLAAGSNRRRLEVPGADRLEHKGLTYCASCDGPLFAGGDVVVVGGGNAGFETAAQLLAYCKHVTLLHRSPAFDKADEVTVDRVLSRPNMTAVTSVDIMEVKGEKFVEAIVYKDQKSGAITELPVSGVFVEVGQIPNTAFAKDVVTLDKLGRVPIDPRTQRTETPGIWAAGDCTDVLYHQNNIAAGDAVRALEDIYLAIHTK